MYALGTIVRHIGHTVAIDGGAYGKVTGCHSLLGWPVVYFPRGTFGPYSEFAVPPANLIRAASVPANLRIALGV